MATNTEIFNVRLRISDPPGFIQFLEVANKAALPSDPEFQTAYLVVADSGYYATSKLTGAAEADYELQDLLVSDIRIGLWIDAYDEDTATCKALTAIVSQLGRQLQIKKIDAGADSTEFTSLLDTLNYYKDLLALCSEEKKSNNNNNSGKMGGSKAPVIGGGNL